MKACQRLQFARLVGAAILVTVWGLGHSNATASSPPVDTVPEVVEDIPYNVSKPSYQGGLLGYNVNVSNLEGNESEVSIDVDPTDPDNQVVVGHAPGFVTMNTFYTMDGGLTWTLVEIDDDVDGLNSDFRIDPTVAFDDDGNVYVGYLARMATQTSVVVCQSTDKGVTYPQCTVVATTDDFEFENELFLGNDKLHLATGPDPDNLTKQNVYIAWTQNVTEDAGIDQRIVLSASTDEGMTFSAPVIINDGSKGGTHAGSLFADPAVGPLGEVYVAWHDIDAGQVFVDVSYDGGATFGTDNLVTTSGTGFKTSIPPQPGRGVHVGPTIDADRSDGPFGGRLYVTYVDLPTDENDLPDTDIFVRYSDDDGAT